MFKQAVKVIDVWGCSDCLHAAANAETNPSNSWEREREIEDGFESAFQDGYTVTAGDGEREEFTARRCGICCTSLAGERFLMHLVKRIKRTCRACGK